MTTIAEQARQDKAMSRDVPEVPEWQLLGCFGNEKCSAKQIADASPVTYVDRNSSPMLLIVGTAGARWCRITRHWKWRRS